jgi:hypothetical protein
MGRLYDDGGHVRSKRPNLRAANRLARHRQLRANRRLGRVNLAESCAQRGWRHRHARLLHQRSPAAGLHAELQAGRLKFRSVQLLTGSPTGRCRIRPRWAATGLRSQSAYSRCGRRAHWLTRHDHGQFSIGCWDLGQLAPARPVNSRYRGDSGRSVNGGVRELFAGLAGHRSACSRTVGDHQSLFGNGLRLLVDLTVRHPNLSLLLPGPTIRVNRAARQDLPRRISRECWRYRMASTICSHARSGYPEGLLRGCREGSRVERTRR